MSTLLTAHIKSLLGFVLLTIILIGMYTRWEKINQNTGRSTYPRPYNINGTSQSNRSISGAKSTKSLMPTANSSIEQSSTPSSNHCPPPEHSGRWRQVSHLSYVFGAYIDTRPVLKVVRIIGVHGTKAKGPNKCHLFFPGDSKPEVIDLQTQINPENHGTSLSAYIYTCNIPKNRTKEPCAVKLLFTNQTQMDSLPIYRPSSTAKRTYTVCVPTLYNYNTSRQLVDTIEVNRFFGANHYVIYNTSTSSEVNKYLLYYIKHNIVTVIPWNLPAAVAKGIHYYGQLVTIQDCFYRSRAISKYVVFMDIDEVIVPRKASTWDEMLRAASKSKGEPRQGGYIIRSRFFQSCGNKGGRQMDMDLQAEAEQLGMYSVLTRTTWKQLYPFRERSKMIIGSEAGFNVGIHFMYGYIPGHGDILVDPAIGMVHHYRWAGKCTEKSEPDNYMDRFAKQLIARVKNVYDHVKKES